MKRLVLTGVLTLSMLFGMFGDLPVAKVCTQASGDTCAAMSSTCQVLERYYQYNMMLCYFWGDSNAIYCVVADMLYDDLGQCWNDYDQNCNYNGI